MSTQKADYRSSAIWAAGLGLLFLLVYGGTNTWSGTLHGVPSLYLGWERGIPFLPWSVVPYWSLDLLFVGSFFLAGATGQLRRHGSRLAAAILGAGALFLVFPLRFAWTRPETLGVTGLLFDALSLDQPFNQLPSLHVALALLIWPLYRRRTGGLVRSGTGLWFLMIGLSAVTTWQHHLVDLVGGLMFGLLVGHAIPLDVEPLDRVGPRHRALAARYGLGALALALPSLAGGVWTTLLLWPAVSLALVASAYLTGRRGFLKADGGGLPISTWLLFGPWLFAVALNARLRRGQAGRAAELEPGLWIGPHPSVAGLPPEVADHPQATLVSLAPEITPARGTGLPTVLVQALDLVSPDPATLHQALEAIAQGLARGPVYLHCALGLGRSAQVAASWLQTRGLEPRAARARVRALRRGALPGSLVAPLHASLAPSCRES